MKKALHFRLFATLLAALVASALPAAPAMASDPLVQPEPQRAMERAEGTHTCVAGKTVTLVVNTNQWGPVSFDKWNGSRFVWQYSSAYGYTHVYDYEQRTVRWSIHGWDISTIAEVCR